MTPTEREYRRKVSLAKRQQRNAKKRRNPYANAQPVTYRPAPQAEEEPDAQAS